MIKLESIAPIKSPALQQTEPEKLIPSTASLKSKQIFDSVVSAVVLISLSILAIPLAILIKLDSSGKVFFIQKRIGLNKKPFKCYKFRTMRALKTNEVVAIEDDRITKFGMFLRKTHIDELPQLINVLKGEMSLVGPRPHMESDTLSFEKIVFDYHDRHIVKPGITGLAQVNGFHGWVDSHDHLQQRIELDKKYIENRTLKMDLAILLKTCLIPFKRSLRT